MQFMKEIDAVISEIHQMYNSVIENLKTAINYYENDEKKNNDLVIDDDKINAYERAIESLCMQILLKETVYSKDFRKVSGALELIDCLERIGDNAYDIKWMADDIKDTNYPLPIEGSAALISSVFKMVEDGLVALVKEDIQLASDIIKRDDIVDKLYWDLVLKLAKLNDNGKIDGKATVLTSHILKYLERIADQATNIAEWTVYIKTGYHKDKVII